MTEFFPFLPFFVSRAHCDHKIILLSMVTIGASSTMDIRAPLHDAHVDGAAQWALTSSNSSLSAAAATSTRKNNNLSYEQIVSNLLYRMQIASQCMELGCESRFAGLILFHRYIRHFYHLVAQNSKQKNQQKQKQKQQNENDESREIDQIKAHLGQVAGACLFLGCKMEEEPRRIRDVINLSHLLNFSSWNSDDTTTTSEEKKERCIPIITESLHPPPLDEQYWKDKEQMVSIEQHVLRTICFDSVVCHPYRCVLIVMETLGFGKLNANETTKTWLLTSQQSDNVILRSYRILNEAALDPNGEALQSPVIVLSCAAISLAAAGGIGCVSSEGACAENKDNGSEDKDDENAVSLPEFWWRALDVSTNELTAAKATLQRVLDR